MTNIALGSDSVKESNWNYAIIDSGTRFIYMSGLDYKNFTTQLRSSGKQAQTLNCDDQPYCYSDDAKCKGLERDLDDLVIQIDGTDYSIPSYGYLLENFDGHECAVAVSYLGFLGDQYVLGDTFIRNFYTSFNYEDMTVSFGRNSDGPVSFEPTLNWWQILLICIGGLLLIILIALGIRYYKGRGKQTGPNIPEDDDMDAELLGGTAAGEREGAKTTGMITRTNIADSSAETSMQSNVPARFSDMSGMPQQDD